MALWSGQLSGAAFWVTVLLLTMPLCGIARGQAVPKDAPLITDLSTHLITINSSFTGTDLLIYGAVDQDGDIVVVVRGPAEPIVVRRKERILGVWVNSASVGFARVPTYYAVAATRSLNEISTPSILGRLRLGFEHLRFEPDTELPAAVVPSFRRAMIEQRARAGLFHDQTEKVVFLGPKLFRVEFEFPANVQVGTYQAEVYLFRNKQVVAAVATPLYVKKSGLEQGLFDMSRQQSALYGVLAIVLSLAAGWIGNFVMRRV